MYGPSLRTKKVAAMEGTWQLVAVSGGLTNQFKNVGVQGYLKTYIADSGLKEYQ